MACRRCFFAPPIQIAATFRNDGKQGWSKDRIRRNPRRRFSVKGSIDAPDDSSKLSSGVNGADALKRQRSTLNAVDPQSLTELQLEKLHDFDADLGGEDPHFRGGRKSGD